MYLLYQQARVCLDVRPIAGIGRYEVPGEFLDCCLLAIKADCRPLLESNVQDLHRMTAPQQLFFDSECERKRSVEEALPALVTSCTSTMKLVHGREVLIWQL